MKLFVDVHGTAQNAEPVLLVHGLGGTSNVWGPQAGVLSRLQFVLCPDNRGCGRSPRAAEVSIAGLVEDLVELIDERGLGAVHLVGHSLGSVVAQHLAVLHPQRVRSLVLVGPIHSPVDATRNALRERAVKARSEGLLGIANLTVQVGLSAESKAHRPEVAAFVRELVMGQQADAYALHCEAIADIEGASLQRLRCPTLVVTGDEDATSPPVVARALAAQIPGARFELLSRCGHWASLEQPQALSRLILDFMLAAHA